MKNVTEGKSVYDGMTAPKLRIPPLSPILEACPFLIKPAALLRALCHDGRLAWDEAQAAARVLEELDCFRPGTVYRLQDWPAKYRAERDRLKRIIFLRAGRAKEAVKDAVKKALFAAIPEPAISSLAAALLKDRNPGVH
ncbi:MAG: hypothetical protein L0Y57_13450 [Beijerinckiaceae bacterium]|nr:hypothetical protein [Beijerinckiaceae bacterium]